MPTAPLSLLLAASCLGLSAAVPEPPLVGLGLGAAPDMRLENCTKTGFDIKDPLQVMECLHGAQEALYCDKKPFTEKSYPGARGGFSCKNQTFDYSPIAALHNVHLYVDGDTKASVGVGQFTHDKKTFHPMEANHYITTILLISTDPGIGTPADISPVPPPVSPFPVVWLCCIVAAAALADEAPCASVATAGPDHKVVAMKQFDPAKDKEPEVTFTDLPHTRVIALAHCNLHGAWATETPSVVPGGGR
jgi:desulfoferrodoxin (superoxide reductase-like protein)